MMRTLTRSDFFRPHPCHLAFLQDTQQADLRIKGHVTDFIEEDRPAIGQFELACRPTARRSGEGAFDMTKQFALHQVTGNGAAIDRHERPATSVAAIMDSLGEQLLASAALTEDQRGRITATGNPRQVQCILNRL